MTRHGLSHGRCAAQTANGPCQMRPLKGSRFCWAHAPHVRAQRRAASAKGGRAGRTAKATTPASVTAVADLQQHIGQALADVLLLPNRERRALAVARLVEVARKLIEVGELETRLELVEARLADMERRTA